MRRPSPSPSTARGQVRIIGGSWRGRRVEFDATEGLRPTPDRVRETLFNWLQPVLEGARCLDLFCGSGVLGLEALSRGAASAVFIDRSAAVIAALQRAIAKLQAPGAQAQVAEGISWLARPGAERFDIVFLDPPYRQGLAERGLASLAASRLLAPQARVYLETAAEEPPPVIPTGWELHRDKRAGGVAYRLLIAPEDGQHLHL